MHHPNAALTILSTLLLSTTAAPAPCPNPSPNSDPLTFNLALSQSTVPLNGLPAPTGLKLSYIALGYGTQNYTCAAAGATPVSIGALAVLYNATFLDKPVFSSEIPTLPALALSSKGGLGNPTLGHHYFAAGGIPTFDLEAAIPQALLSAAKVGDVAAPSASVPNSVDWLFLQDNGNGKSRNLKAVYRVETAGGKAGTCVKAGVVTVPYAAEYWFFD